MRRAQAILVIVALLGTPLALLARSTDTAMSSCVGICCPAHRSHAAHTTHGKMLCQHGEAGYALECTMKSGHQGIDYGFVAPLAPTAPSAVVYIGTPAVGLESIGNLHEVSTSGFLSDPFQPPRIHPS